MKALLIAASSLYVVTSHAADISKLGTGTNLADAASWTDSVVPGSSDIATWGGTSLATGLTLGTNVEWQGVRITGSSGSGTVSVTGAGTLSLGASGINLEGSAVGATFANALSLTAAQSWRVNAGRTLTVSGALSGSGALSIGGAPAHTSSIFLTGTYQTIATNVTLDNVTGIAGLLGGSWINSQRTTAGHGYLVSSASGSQVYWLQGLDGAVKAVKVELQQSGSDVQARVTAAKYQESALPGFNFETAGAGAALSTANTSDGYGVFSLGLLTDASPANQTGQVTLSGTNSSYSGNIQVNRGRLVFGSGSEWNGGNSPSAGTGTLTVGPLGVVSNSAPNAIWGGHTNTRTVILNGGVIDLENHQEYFHTLEMTAGLVTRGVFTASTTLFRVGSAVGAGRIVTNASAASAQIVGGVDLTFNSLRLEVADGAAANDLVISAAITQNTGAGSGAKSVTKEGAGAVLLSGTNTFTGGVLVNAGTVRVGHMQAFGAANTAVGTVTVASGATIDFNGEGAVYGYTISGTGVGGAGALVNNGSLISTFSAQTSNLRLAANATIGGTGEWGVLGAGYAATSVDLAGFTLTKAGSNGIHLANTTFTAGSLNIARGAIFLNLNSATSNLSSVAVTLANVAGASLGLNGKSLTVASLSGGGTTGGNVTLGVGTLTVGNASSTTYSGVISGSGGLVKQGSGTLTLTRANTYSGGTTVSAGTLELTGGALAGNISVGASGTMRMNHGDFGVVYGGQLSGTGNVVVTGASNDLQLSGNNSSFTGTLTVSGGAQLRLRNDNAVSGAALVLESGGAASVYNYVGTAAFNVASLASSDPTTWIRLGSESNRGLTVGSNNQSTTFAGVIKNDVGGIGSVTKVGSGTLTLTGANTYSGGTTVSAGTLRLGANAGAGTGTITLGDASTGSSNVLLMVNNNSDPSNAIVVSALGTGTVTIGTDGGGEGNNPTIWAGNLTLNRATRLTSATTDRTSFDGIISGNVGTLTIVGGWRTTFSNAGNNYVGDTVITSGSILQINNASGALPDATNLTVDGSLYFNELAQETVASLAGSGRVQVHPSVSGAHRLNVAGAASTTFSGTIVNGGGTVALGKSGSGSLALTGANTYTGGTFLSSGTLEFASGSLGSSGTVTLSGGTLRWASGNTQDISSRLAFSGSTALDTNGNDVSLGSALTGGSSLILTKSGAGTLTLSGASSALSSAWTITGGTLKAGHVQAFGTGAIRVEGGVLDLNGLAVANVFALAGGSVTGFTSLDASQLDFTSNPAPKLSGVIAGELDLTNKAVDATGGLTAAGTLKGDGAVFSGGTVTLDDGAIHAPGSSPGTQTFESGLTYAAGATLDWEIELDPGDWAAATPQRGPDYDAINVTGGNLVIGSGATLLVTLLDPLGGASFTDVYWDELRILQAINFSSVGQITGAFTLDASAANAVASGRGEWSMTQDSSGVYLQWTPVPEPSTYGLILGGLALAGAALRRRRKVS